MSPRAHRARLAAALAIAALVGACADDRAHARADSALARDLALAAGADPGVDAARPVTGAIAFGDTALAAASREAPRPTPAASPEVRRDLPAPPPPVPASRRAAPRPAAVSVPAPSAPRPTPANSTDVPGSVPAPMPAPAAPAPATVPGFAAGTRFGAITASDVCTGTARPGDKLIARLQGAQSGTGGATLPAGAVLVLEVAEVVRGATPEESKVTFRVRSIEVNEQAVSLSADARTTSPLERMARADAAGDRRRVVGGAIAGAIAGQVLGGDTKSTVIGAAAGAAAGTAASRGSTMYDGCFPAGGSLEVTLVDALRVAGAG